MSALAAGCNKKRKKSETKPQAQINKCNNEKRRREQENIYIEELAELISANFADMSSLSVKPDKCAILQEAVNQIRSIKQQETATQSDPVQQGEVSSSRPTILSNEVYGPLLLEALEGFLFVVNSEGKVEHVTENVSNYIRFTRDDVLGRSIYNFIHHGDHAKFHSNLLPMTIDWGNDQAISNRSKSIDIRLLVKPPDDLDETVEEKQQRISRYELMHISSTQLRDQLSVSEEDGSDSGPCLLCVASRISHRDKASCSIEQFTTKLDTSGKIICVDTSGVSDNVAQYIKKELKNRGLREVVPQTEVHKVNVHLKETLSAGNSTSHIYKLQVGPERFIQIQTKSKLFRTNLNSPSDMDFIMSTHSIIGENDGGGRPTDPGGGSSNSSGSTGVGGPLMTSVVNGTRNGPPPSSLSDITTSSSSNSLLHPNPTFSSFNLENDFNFEIFPSSSNWELDSNWQESRPDSRQSVSPVSTPTPRPPSNSSYSNAPAVSNNPPTPANHFTSFSFSPINGQSGGYPIEEQDSKANVLEEAAVLTESKRLRNLLEKPVDSKDKILKDLLNQTDDSLRNDNRCSPRGMIHRDSMPGPSKGSTSSASTGNNMLRKLLNEKSEENDDVEPKTQKKSELLHRLLNTTEGGDCEEDRKPDLRCHDDTLMRSLGFPSSPGGNHNRKRSSDERDDGPSKRSSDGQQVTSSLQVKNKMLASLLAITPPNHQPIPPIPESILTQTPHEVLPKATGQNKSLQMAMNQQNAQNSRANVNRMPGRPTPTSYLSSVLSSPNCIQRNDIRQINQINSNCYSSPASSSTDNNNMVWDNNNAQTSDPFLSELLDQVIEIVPDDIMHLLDGGSHRPPLNCHPRDEAKAIDNIQKSLMQCEKSPLSPISLPGTPPAYSSSNLTNQNNSTLAFPPPPNYPQAKYQRMQMRAGTVQQQFAGTINNPMLLRKQQMMQQQQQQEHKRRLLQQQKQQQLLIPSNAAANEMNSMQNIDSLLNNTVAPNVSLQRSSSVPEPQLSPGYGGQLSQQALRVGSQQPYSPHSQMTTSPLSQQSFTQNSSVGNYQNQSARLSPQSQFNAQLSPRQSYPQGNNQPASWQQPQARLSAQQNPMLSAQLTRPPQQQQRTLNSPGSVPTRHSPYPSDQFAPPSSPNSAFNSQYLRIQRANSVPTATTQLPGGLGSPRSYTGREHHPHPYSSIQPHHTVPQMMYQQDSQYCYDQTGLPLAYNGADRGRATPHLQPGVSGSGPTSEFVRQELRAVVGARTAQSQPSTSRPSSQMITQQQVSDLESLGINFEMSGASDSPKLWGAMGSDIGSMSPQPATSRTTMAEGQTGDPTKASLLQKLLSE